MEPEHVDVVIVGAGLSGIGAAYHLQSRCPHKSYLILEARERSGGTWDLFQYPGVRSDSDMYTLGYSFAPWTNPKAIADGASILQYIRSTATTHGIAEKIRYRMKVEGARWSSERARWTLSVRDQSTGELTELSCNFLFMCAGYYDYDEGYTPAFPGRDRFAGVVVHPQKWSPDINYEGKRVVVIGSGATAVTLVPELAKRAAHVTMLQRSPTYIGSLPAIDPVAEWLRARFSPMQAYALMRWKNVLLSMAFYNYCRQFPERAKRALVGMVKKQVGAFADVETDFTPSYKPWDQRLCFVPDGDLFDALRSGRASVVTDQIASFTETGLLLQSGIELPADLIVTATGLKLKFLGGMALDVDGRRVVPNETFTYKGMMFSDVPNLAVAIGYTNASWTLKCDLTSEFVCRLLNHMDAHGYTRCCPRMTDPSIRPEPILNFSSGYVQRSIHEFPRQGSIAPWRLYQNYVLDLLTLRHARIEDQTMEFR